MGHTCSEHSVADRHGHGTTLGGSHRTKFEAVPTMREGSSAISVLDTRWHSHGVAGSRIHDLFFRIVPHQGSSGDDGIDVGLESLAGVQGNDGRGCFLGTQSVVISSVGNSATHQLVVLTEAIGQARQGCDVQLARRICLSRRKEIRSSVSAHGPVAMLARPVDALEWLLVEEHMQPQLLCLLGSNLHEEDVGVCGSVGDAEDG
mmetsp:Transcript_77951/g.170784  ORF Transcript_77951/g.170784 Transcript_77951/m.170784 type:complete len:204 (+) Transcript_77951:1034-1645(+)